MSVVINFKICDNAKECDGIKACPVGAFKWDDEKQTIYVDNDACIDCGACESACTVNAVKVTKSKEEYDEALKSVDEDLRTRQDLFCERYGASPIQEELLYKESEINPNTFILSRPLMVELFSDDTIMCLLRSIPITELLANFDSEATYKKVEVVEGNITKEYGVTQLPALLFFKDGKLIHKEEGFVEDRHRKELLERVHKILN